MKPGEQELTKETVEALKDLLLNESVWALELLRELAECSPAGAENLWKLRTRGASPGRLSALHLESMKLLHFNDFRARLIGDKALPESLNTWIGQLEEYAVQVDPYYTQRPELRACLNLLRSSRIPVDYHAVPKLQILIDDIRVAEKQFAIQDVKKELQLLRASRIYDLGLAYSNGGKDARAISTIVEGLAFCEENKIDAEINRFRLRLAYLYQKGASKIDDSLRQTLPLYKVMKTEPVSLDRIDLQLLLANTYLKAEDAYESRQYLNRAVEELDQLNLTYTPMETADRFLNRWQSLCPLESPPDIFHHFKVGMALQMQVQRIRSGLAENEAERDKWDECFSVLTRGDLLFSQLEAEISHRSELFSVEMGLIDSAGTNNATDEAPQVIAFELSRRIEECQQLLEAGDFSEETLSLIDSIAEMEGSQHKETTLVVHRQRGEFFVGRGKIPLADKEYAKALNLAVEMNNLTEILDSIFLRIALLEVEERKDRLKLTLKAISYIETARREVSTPYQQGSFLKGKTIYFDLAMVDAYHTNQPLLMIRIGELVKGQIARLDWVSEQDRREMTRKQGDIYQQLRIADEPTSKALKRQRQHLYDSMMLAQPDRGATEDLFAGFSIHLEPGEACISYYQLEGGVFLIFSQNANGDRVLLKENTDQDELATNLRLYATQRLPAEYRGRQAGNWYTLEPFASKRRARRKERIASLVKFLFPPEVKDIIDGCNRLYLCPHRKLHGIPFQALPYSDNEYLIERYAISYIPNLKVLFRPRQPCSIDGEPVFIGSAEYPEFKLPPLPGAKSEVNRITELWRQGGHNPVSLLDGRATRANVIEAVKSGHLGKAPIIHVAVHGEDAPEDAPTEARLFLCKGALNGFDISLWKIKPELVILSSCFSGARTVAGRGMDTLPGDDIFGLQAAFFSAGAKRILGARWAVDDGVGEELMAAFHAKLTNLSPAFAWQQTVIDYLREADEDKRKTVYWASFFLTEAEL